MPDIGDVVVDLLLATVGFAFVVVPAVGTFGSLVAPAPFSHPSVLATTLLAVELAAAAFVVRAGSFSRLGAFIFRLCATATVVGIAATTVLVALGRHGFLSTPAFPASVAAMAYLAAFLGVYAPPPTGRRE